MPAPGERHALASEHRRRRLRVEALDDDHRAAERQRAEDVHRAGDVREREHAADAVVLGHLEPLAHADGRGLDRGVGVLRALGVGRRAGRVVVEADRQIGGIVGRRRRRRQLLRIALRQHAIGDEDLEPGLTAGDLAGHLLVVEVAPCARHDQQPRPGLLRDEADLALAVDRQHRVLDGAEPRQRGHERKRFEPRRQLPRHDVALTDAEAGEAGGGALGLGLVLGERERAAVLVDGHHRIGCRLDPLLEQLPQVAGVNHVVSLIAVSFAHA